MSSMTPMRIEGMFIFIYKSLKIYMFYDDIDKC